MTLELFLWGAAAAILFAVTNAIAFKRGEVAGHQEGYDEGVMVKIERVKKEVYAVRYGEREDESE